MWRLLPSALSSLYTRDSLSSLSTSNAFLTYSAYSGFGYGIVASLHRSNQRLLEIQEDASEKERLVGKIDTTTNFEGEMISCRRREPKRGKFEERDQKKKKNNEYE
jgi:hypothetical protein